MERLVLVLEKEIAGILPNKFGLILDGWTSGSDHFVAIFATYMYKDVAQQTLLAMSPMGDEPSLAVSAITEFIEETLLVYRKNLNNIGFIVSDNTASNPRLAADLGVPFVGCMSHRLNLSFESFLKDNIHSDLLLNKVHEIMICLRSIKMRAALRKYTALAPC